MWDAAAGAFEQQHYPTRAPFAAYAASRGLATPAAVAEAAAAYGANSFALPLPTLRELMSEQLSAPFFVFQLFCVALWCLDEYWQYSVLTLFMLIVFESTVASTRLRTACDLRALGAPPQPVRVHRCGAWLPMAPEELLPGDVVSIGAAAPRAGARHGRAPRLTHARVAGRPRGAGSERWVVPADLLLLAGSAITEEALLTGETAPQWKSAAPGAAAPQAAAAANGDGAPAATAAAAGSNGDTVLDLKKHRQHIIFGGTKVRACMHAVVNAQARR